MRRLVAQFTQIMLRERLMTAFIGNNPHGQLTEQRIGKMLAKRAVKVFCEQVADQNSK